MNILVPLSYSSLNGSGQVSDQQLDVVTVSLSYFSLFSYKLLALTLNVESKCGIYTQIKKKKKIFFVAKVSRWKREKA